MRFCAHWRPYCPATQFHIPQGTTFLREKCRNDLCQSQVKSDIIYSVRSAMAFTKSVFTMNTSETACRFMDKAGNEAQKPSPIPHLAFAFLVLFVPLTIIPLILCAYILQNWRGSWGIDLASYSRSCQGLPGNERVSDSYFYTEIAVKYVLLTSSWLSNVAQFATTPFCSSSPFW